MHTFTLTVAAVYPRIDIEAAVVRVCAYVYDEWLGTRDRQTHTEREMGRCATACGCVAACLCAAS
jgi:hypothetical protein